MWQITKMCLYKLRYSALVVWQMSENQIVKHFLVQLKMYRFMFVNKSAPATCQPRVCSVSIRRWKVRTRCGAGTIYLCFVPLNLRKSLIFAD